MSTIRSKAKAADRMVYESAELTGGKRHIRYNCLNAASNYDIYVGNDMVPNTADDSWQELLDAVEISASRNEPNRKYLVFVDWPDPDGHAGPPYCGQAEWVDDDDFSGETNASNLGKTIAVVYMRSPNPPCGAWARTALHEMVHTMGGVQLSAARHDPLNQTHPNDEWDLMAYAVGDGSNVYMACTDQTKDNRLDCNNNDYFDTSPAAAEYLSDHWNVARSRFLVKPLA